MVKGYTQEIKSEADIAKSLNLGEIVKRPLN